MNGNKELGRGRQGQIGGRRSRRDDDQSSMDGDEDLWKGDDGERHRHNGGGLTGCRSINDEDTCHP